MASKRFWKGTIVAFGLVLLATTAAAQSGMSGTRPVNPPNGKPGMVATRDGKTSATAARRAKARNPQGQSQDCIGKAAPGFKSITLDGNQIDLKDYRGKYVLVTYWAVWCGFCIAEVPSLKAIHEEFGKDPRFVMIGLSLDKDMGKLENYVKTKEMNWTQGFLGDWAKDKVTPIWDVNDIPDLFLIGPDGKIIARNAHGKLMRDEIAKALGKAAEKAK